MANALGHNEDIALLQLNGTGHQLDPQFALQDKENFVFVVVGVPRQTSVDLRDLDVRVVDLSHYPWRPKLCERTGDHSRRKHFLHSGAPSFLRAAFSSGSATICLAVLPCFRLRKPARLPYQLTGV